MAEIPLDAAADCAAANAEPAQLDSGFAESNLIRGCFFCLGLNSRNMRNQCDAGGRRCSFNKLSSAYLV